MIPWFHKRCVVTFLARRGLECFMHRQNPRAVMIGGVACSLSVPKTLCLYLSHGALKRVCRIVQQVAMFPCCAGGCEHAPADAPQRCCDAARCHGGAVPLLTGPAASRGPCSRQGVCTGSTALWPVFCMDIMHGVNGMICDPSPPMHMSMQPEYQQDIC